MPSPKPKSLAETMREREDDARELAKRAAAETVAQKVQRYLSNKMSGDEMKRFYGTNQKDIEAEQVRREEAPSKHGKAIWIGAEGAGNYYEEQKTWTEQHPQLPQGNLENLHAIADWLREKNLPPSAVNVNEAFVALTMEGRLLLDPSACGAGPETEVTGSALIKHPNLWKILEPVRIRNVDPEQERINRMSADQYRASRPELQPQGVPALILQQVEKALGTFISSCPAYVASEKNKVLMLEWLKETRRPVSVGTLIEAYESLRRGGLLEVNQAVMEHGQTRLIDCGPREPGHPAQPKKYSFRKKLEAMTADEVKQRIFEDPNFETALDNFSK